MNYSITCNLNILYIHNLKKFKQPCPESKVNRLLEKTLLQT